jgi:hypothetical protein
MGWFSFQARLAIDHRNDIIHISESIAAGLEGKVAGLWVNGGEPAAERDGGLVSVADGGAGEGS